MRQIPLGKNRGFALVDDEDFERVSAHKWYINSETCATTYATTNSFSVINGQKKRVTLGMHRFIMNAPNGVLVDHIDGNGLNNCRSNLRLCNRSQNGANSSIPRNNKLGFKGICKRRKRFYAQVIVNWEMIATGSFATPEEAAKAYDKLALEHFGEFAKTNFPKELYQNPEFGPKLGRVWSSKIVPKKRIRKPNRKPQSRLGVDVEVAA